MLIKKTQNKIYTIEIENNSMPATLNSSDNLFHFDIFFWNYKEPVGF